MENLLISDSNIYELISEEQSTESFLTIESFSTTDIDYSAPSFTGLGITAGIALFSLGVAVLLKLLQRTSS